MSRLINNTVEIEKRGGLRSVKCENVETHRQHCRDREGERTAFSKYDNVGTHKRYSLPVEIDEERSRLRLVKYDNVMNDTYQL